MCANVITQEGSPWALKRLTSTATVTDNTPGYTYNANASGEGVMIYVLDEFIRGTHDEFLKEAGGTARRIRIPVNAVGPVYENFSFHGTFVAGVAAGLTYGVAKSAYLGGLSARELDHLPTQLRLILRNRTRKFDGTARPANANPRPAVINVSNDYPITDVRVTLFYIELIKAGVHVVVAAGNAGIRREANWCFDSQVNGQHVVVPEADRGHVHSVIWVGASTKTDRRWTSSNYGPLIDLFAPGAPISSAGNQSDTAVELAPGTSFAAPHVAGIIACLLSDPQYRDLTPAQMKQKVLATAWQNQVEGVTVPDLLKPVLWGSEFFCNSSNMSFPAS
ncbi:hypothetical protein M413DRAFT_178904 [Hebeloma cylindrosporum]|uniref:Peptidase S8/S53 domain-containing protein n=1 Tax=Hebeloma cylindrosporum TaxID=76867 RepID=A0A0C2XRR4_HEBCY|nr:hypothetical protein M413DRAFT_178904 [Hebeloma cylindrosporum h7]